MTAEAARRGLYYVYALTDGALPRRFSAAGRTLRTIRIDRVSAVVETARGRREATEQALREQHAIVVGLAARTGAVLPVRFGALFTPAELDARVKSAHDSIVAALDRVRGRVQMTVRLHSPPAAAVSTPFPSGTAYLAARSERERALRRHAAEVRRAVESFVVDERLDPGKGDLQGTVYHLVKATDAERYRAAIAAAAAALAPVELSVTGPWPAFAFVPELRT